MDNLDEASKIIIKKFPVFELAERGKLRCTITGHELPARNENLDFYTKTSKFIRAFKMSEIMNEFGEYFDDLGNNRCGCKLTKRIISKDPDDLLRHIEGRKFRVALEKAETGDEYETSGELESDASMEEGSVPPQRKESNTFDDEEEEKMEEMYPEFLTSNNAASDNDNNDISAMDTEYADINNRKRKTENPPKHKRKKRK